MLQQLPWLNFGPSRVHQDPVLTQGMGAIPPTIGIGGATTNTMSGRDVARAMTATTMYTQLAVLVVADVDDGGDLLGTVWGLFDKTVSRTATATLIRRVQVRVFARWRQ